MSGDLTSALGTNLRQLRRARRLSLAKLAEVSGVSRAMLSQIEVGRSAPTVNVLWRITRALDIPFAGLLDEPEQSTALVQRAHASQRATSADGAVVSRSVFSADCCADVDVQELLLRPGATAAAGPLRAGGKAHLFVVDGRLTVTVGNDRHLLDAGDAVLFHREQAHSYANEQPDCARVLVVVDRRRATAGRR